MTEPQGNGIGQRKFTIALRSLNYTLGLTLMILGVSAFLLRGEQGTQYAIVVGHITTMWPWVIGAIGGWFGVSNAATHYAHTRNGSPRGQDG